MNRQFLNPHPPIINPTRLSLAKRRESTKAAGCREYRAIGLYPILRQYLKSPFRLLIDRECRCPKRPHLLAYDILYRSHGVFQIPAKEFRSHLVYKQMLIRMASNLMPPLMDLPKHFRIGPCDPAQTKEGCSDAFLIQEIQDFR